MKFTIKAIRGSNGNRYFVGRPWKLAVAVWFVDDDGKEWQFAVACDTSFYAEQIAEDIDEIFPLLTSFKEMTQLYEDCIIYEYSTRRRDWWPVYIGREDIAELAYHTKMQNQIFLERQEYRDELKKKWKQK